MLTTALAVGAKLLSTRSLLGMSPLCGLFFYFKFPICIFAIRKEEIVLQMALLIYDTLGETNLVLDISY